MQTKSNNAALRHFLALAAMLGALALPLPSDAASSNLTAAMSADPVPASALAAPASYASLGSSSSSSSAFSSTPAQTTGPAPQPPTIQDLEDQAAAPSSDDTNKQADLMGLQIRADAIREAALSYGARGGLAYRTFEIQRRLAEYDISLNKTFNFSRLLVAAPTGLMIEPPVVSEAQRAVLVNTGGQAAATADRVYRINRNARIVTAPRNWHLYLERDWGRVDPPPGLLLPRDDDERAAWRKYVQEGWAAGVQQAEETFEADLDRLTADFVGMVRYRELLAQGMISPPYALADDRGVTGGGSEMRVGDRGVTITGPSALIPRSDSWTPATR
ncbi:MAG TPA: type IV secretory system conjugative DNA transfer family protein [Alphaproteobacteria bacterium]|nr:type IV secretory system conjugative DNA transfer family protein [Alphaproteobacteria bacterium]